VECLCFIDFVHEVWVVHRHFYDMAMLNELFYMVFISQFGFVSFCSCFTSL